MLLGCIADDFTGASDIANTLARGGMRTRLVVGTTSGFVSNADCDAVVIALKTRSIPADDAVAQSLNALERLRAAGCCQFFFKYCSTFDSTSDGNIGPVAEALAEALGARSVIVCPAFPATGRTVYQGHLFVGDRLLSESGMERHPLTPMTDPDIRRWLSRQCTSTPGHVAHATVRAGAGAISQALATADQTLIVVDALSDDDLRSIGEAAANAVLITGGSGVAIGLPDNFRRLGRLGAGAPAFVGNDRSALILSGSCSVATREQVAAYAADHPAVEVDIDALIEGKPILAMLEAFVVENAEHAPLIYSSALPGEVAAAQGRHGLERTANAVERLFGDLAQRAVLLGFGRIVVAGGETSGAVVTALGIDALDLGIEIDPGVPALSVDGLALALKSGNFGSQDFFAKAVRALGARHG